MINTRLTAVFLALALSAPAAFAVDKIEFWTFSLKPKFIPYFDALVTKYEAQNPNVKIEWVDFPWDIIQTKLITRIVAGTPPALVNLNVPWADEYARDGLIVPVDALMGEARATHTRAAIEDLSFNGRLYGFPLYSNVAIIAYNTTLFKQAGLTRGPKNIDEELAFADQMYARTGVPGFAPLLGKIDGLFLQQGLAVIKDGKAAFNSPAHVALVRKLAASYKNGGLFRDKLFSEDNFPAVIDAYKGGRLGMLLAPPTALGRIQADARDIYAITDIAPAPLGPTGIADGGWMVHFGVPRGVDPKLLPAVGKFARYLTNAENQLAFAKLANVFPTTIVAANDAYFQAPAGHATPAQKGMTAGAASMNHSHTLYVAGVEDYDELRRSLVNAVEAGVTGKKDVRQALDEAVIIWNKKLAKK
ncbi:MAG TPA: extracellular solute-binding protein [Janthinobacterium sp.]|nr:extracellular solute-binding protein [Janthinobacterium sp.]